MSVRLTTLAPRAPLAVGALAALFACSGSNSPTDPHTKAPGPGLVFSTNPVTFDQYAYGRTLAASQTTAVSVRGGGALGQLAQAGSIRYSGTDANWLASVKINGANVSLAPNTTSLSIGSDTAKVPFSAGGSTDTLTVIVNTWVTYTKLVLGNEFACGLTTAQTVYCWGKNFLGALGTGVSAGTLATSLPVRALLPTSPGNGVIDIAAGAYHSCAIMQSNAVYCWGNNTSGELGLGTSDNSEHPTPTQIPNKTYSQITAGLYHTCGVEGTGGSNYLDCWGANEIGELGMGIMDQNPHPTPTSTGSIFLPGYASAGGEHTCALTATGALYCWGGNISGEIGVGVTGGQYTTPQLVKVNGHGLATTYVSAGNRTTCAIDAQAHAYCWGENSYGELGDSTITTTPVASPTEVPRLQFTVISSGLLQTCGLALGGVPYCWGDDDMGRLGNGITGGDFSAPQPVIISGGATQLVTSASSDFGCYLASTGAYCFGNNSVGQLGVSSISETATPRSIVGQPAPSGVGP